MFINRRYRFASNHGLNRRRLWEEFLHMAAKMSEINTDSLKLKQFGRSEFQRDVFYVGEYHFWWNETQVLRGRGSFVPIEVESRHFNGPGMYNISWSLNCIVRNNATYHVEAYPYLGSQILTTMGDLVRHPAPYLLANYTGTRPTSSDEFDTGENISLSGSGIATIANETLRCGIVGITHTDGNIEINGGSIAVTERLI